MALIDSDNFITHLVWSGLIDKATCGELKEAIELCTVKDVYTKADMVAMLEELNSEIRKLRVKCVDELDEGLNIGVTRGSYLVQQKIDKLKENKDAI